MAIAVIVHHRVSTGREAEARDRILGNGRVMQRHPGFVGRQTLIAEGDRAAIVTVTVWRTREDYDGWMSSDAKQSLPSSAALWTVSPEVRIYDVVGEP